MVTKIRRKVFINKRTKQMSVSIPKKQVKLTNPTIKFGEDLFVELTVLNKDSE